MNNVITTTVDWVFSPSISVGVLLFFAVVCKMVYTYGSRVYNNVLGKYYYHKLEGGDWQGAMTLLLTKNKYTIIQPAIISVKGLNEEYSDAILEVSSGFTCKYEGEYDDSKLRPAAIGIILNDEQALAIKESMESFLELNRQGAKMVRPSSDGRVIDIKNLFKKKD